MEYIYSEIEKNKLYIIYRIDDFKDIKNSHRKDIVDEKEFIQLSALKMKKGQTFKPHQHIWKKKKKR